MNTTRDALVALLAAGVTDTLDGPALSPGALDAAERLLREGSNDALCALLIGALTFADESLRAGGPRVAAQTLTLVRKHAVRLRSHTLTADVAQRVTGRPSAPQLDRGRRGNALVSVRNARRFDELL